MTDTSSNSDGGALRLTIPEAVDALSRDLHATKAQLQATQIVLATVLATLRQRRTIPLDAVHAIRAVAESAPRLGEPFDAAFAEAIDILLYQVESPRGGKPHHPGPKLVVVGSN